MHTLYKDTSDVLIFHYRYDFHLTTFRLGCLDLVLVECSFISKKHFKCYLIIAAILIPWKIWSVDKKTRVMITWNWWFGLQWIHEMWTILKQFKSFKHHRQIIWKIITVQVNEFLLNLIIIKTVGKVQTKIQQINKKRIFYNYVIIKLIQ